MEQSAPPVEQSALAICLVTLFAILALIFTYFVYRALKARKLREKEIKRLRRLKRIEEYQRCLPLYVQDPALDLQCVQVVDGNNGVTIPEKSITNKSLERTRADTLSSFKGKRPPSFSTFKGGRVGTISTFQGARHDTITSKGSRNSFVGPTDYGIYSIPVNEVL